MKKVKTTLIITASFIGFHRWPQAPQEVAYLRDLHRHKFNVRIGVRVTGHDREQEFHTLQSAFRERWNGEHGHRGAGVDASCESLAFRILEMMEPEGAVWCEVWEDNENGARVEK